MQRREALGLIGAGTVGILGMGGAAAAAQEGHDAHASHAVMDACARACNELAAHCLKQATDSAEGRALHLKAHEAAIDCQEFCRMTSALAARGSSMAVYAHEACANACRDCAKVCGEGQDDVMKRCAEACKACETHCREAVGGHEAHHEH